MPSLPQSTPPTPPPAIDLSEITERTRRALYDAVVAVHFSPTPEEIREAKREGEWFPTYSADECRVTVAYLAGSYAESRIMPTRRITAVWVAPALLSKSA